MQCTTKSLKGYVCLTPQPVNFLLHMQTQSTFKVSEDRIAGRMYFTVKGIYSNVVTT